jgi:tetratricopeptide (TPR) repeat protein
MPGNRALYDRAMEQSREAARLKQWDEALKQAVRALQEFPQDVDARSSAAVALFNTGRHDRALQLFEELRAGDQNNPFFLEYIARIHEQAGDITAAVASYTQLADLQQSRRLAPRAIDALRDVLRLRPDADDHRLRMAQLLEETGAAGQAAAEYLELSRRAQTAGRLDEAAARAEDALRLDPGNREAKEQLAALHASLAEAVQTAVASGTEGALPVAPLGMTGALRSQQFALEKIIALAQEHQQAGDAEGAIEQYERAIKLGLERSDVFYSLGLLRQERGEHEQAVAYLSRATSDPEFALSAHYALGASYQALGQLPQAANEYEQTLRLVDLQSIGRAEVDDLIQMYESAASIYISLNDIARAASLYSSLAAFLQGKRWGKERADEFKQKAKELTERNMFAKLRLMGTGTLVAPPEPEPEPAPLPDSMPETWGKIRPITDFLKPDRVARPVDAAAPPAAEPPAAPDPLAVLEALPPPEKPAFAPVTPLDTAGLDEIAAKYVLASEKYIEQGLLLAALDAAHEVIRLAPDYLPIHLRMGEIYERAGRPDEALTKYQLLIDTYIARGEPRRAIDVYYRLIELSPDTINARSKLADLLRGDGRSAEAAAQLAVVAAASFRMGQTNKALEEYRRALQWAPESAAIHAQYGQALLKLERYEAALGEFRHALELAPDDPVGIARVNIALALQGAHPAAVWQSLHSLIQALKARPQHLGAVQAEYRQALLVADVSILHYVLGIVEQEAGLHPSALLAFEQAAALRMTDEDPMLPPVLIYQAMADSSIALGQAQEALAQLRRANEMAADAPPPPPDARFPFSTPLSRGDMVRRMAEAYAASDDLDGAEAALREAKEHLPYDRTIYTKLADIYFRQGRLNEALAQLDELATHYESRQDLDRAIETLDYALKLAPNNIPLGRRAAQLNLRRGYLDRGVEGLVRVAELQRKAGQLKDAVASLQQAAEVHWTLGQQEKAAELYDRIVRVAPNDLEARQWLSFMYTLAGRIPDAVAEKKQMVRIYLQQREYDAAIAELHQIYGLDQSDLETLFTLGDVLMRREEYEQALRTYTRLARQPGVDIERVEALQAAARRMLDQQQARVKG